MPHQTTNKMDNSDAIWEKAKSMLKDGGVDIIQQQTLFSKVCFYTFYHYLFYTDKDFTKLSTDEIEAMFRAGKVTINPFELNCSIK